LRVRALLAPQASLKETALLQRRFSLLTRYSKSSVGRILEGEISSRALEQFTASKAVLWIEPAGEPRLFDALAGSIIAGENENLGLAIHDLGFDGEGVTVAVADSGLNLGEGEEMHPDLEGRVDAFFYYGNLTDASDEHSHGTHVTGIIAGDGAAGETDEFGYLYGLGIAPKAHIVAQRMFDGLGGYHAPPSMAALTTDAVRAGAEIGSNSWGEDTQGRYDIFAMEFDALVRDADPETPGDQPYILEFSAGNAGPADRTIGSPAVAKNVIATGASQNERYDFLIYAGMDGIADFSSRGPCEDGRIKPDLCAPGTWIASLQSMGAGDENAWMPISSLYQYQGGTSQAGPQVSGAAAVFVQYYRETHGGATPSPALVKAALINSATDMDNELSASEGGTTFIPNNDEGWGRVDLTELIGADRKFDFTDQTALLRTGQTFE
jgi:subtilisin family serine protease